VAFSIWFVFKWLCIIIFYILTSLFITMPTENFDIYDENNNPLWITKSRKIVHSELKDWHRVSHIWIYNDVWEILCQKRSVKKDSNPWLWMSFFGWHLKAWETYEENAINELEEEIWL
jgi:isopentenyldiphosphate isomerase